MIWIHVLPNLKGYAIRQALEKVPDGAQATRLIKIPNQELAEWDATHDEHGEIVTHGTTSDSEKPTEVAPSR